MIKKVLKRFLPHSTEFYRNRLLRRVNEKKLASTLRRVGVENGAMIYVQSSFGSLGYYPNGMPRFIRLLGELVGPTGTIVMPCFPFGGAMEDYVASTNTFDARTSASKIGGLPEVMRQIEGVRRSCHPSHSVVALGHRADWLVEGHEACDTPQGIGSPFDKMTKCGAMILRINTPAFAFAHHLQEMAEWPNLFIEHIAAFHCADDTGTRHEVKTRVYRKKVPFIMYLPGPVRDDPVAINIMDFPVVFESREAKFRSNDAFENALAMLLDFRSRLEVSGCRRMAMYNDCRIDSLICGDVMSFAVTHARSLLEEFSSAYELAALEAGLENGSISI